MERKKFEHCRWFFTFLRYLHGHFFATGTVATKLHVQKVQSFLLPMKARKGPYHVAAYTPGAKVRMETFHDRGGIEKIGPLICKYLKTEVLKTAEVL